MIKKINDDNDNFSPVESFFSEKSLVNKTRFDGYQLVKYQNGEYGVVNTTIYIIPDKQTSLNKNSVSAKANKYIDLVVRGTEEDIRKTYAYYKERYLGIKPQKISQLREFSLKDNQKIIANIESININIKNGTAELKLETNKKKLMLKVDQGFAQHLKQGQKISILKVPEGIKMNVLKARVHDLTRSR